MITLAIFILAGTGDALQRQRALYSGQIPAPARLLTTVKTLTSSSGRHNKTAFTGLNSTTAPVPFNINLTNCENVGSVFMR
jgi:type 1 fimbria pilin